MRKLIIITSILFAVLLSGSLFIKNYNVFQDEVELTSAKIEPMYADTLASYSYTKESKSKTKKKSYKYKDYTRSKESSPADNTPEVIEEPVVINNSEPRLIDDIIKLLETLSPFLVPIITYYFARKGD